ncbi:sugar ABC transporter substrate-binding protein [Clostridium sp. AF19-22AC]|uniref:sugar ABC transporter substrate-binding protein n=1 Tax=Clostridia TaxID=186801 RepID=UPI000E4CC151|nr:MULTISPECIES: substrate-binding domain-containing protein [Clostridia]RHR25869.1 sugar ABC transporter substrate-binding protein [Clostridium sp. AF19-22AC]
MKKFQNKNIKIHILVIAMLLLVTAVIGIAEITLNGKISLGDNGTEEEKSYDYHIAMIGGSSSKDDFWNSIYEGARAQGEKYSMYVENFGAGLSSDYSCKELLQMAIAAKVDGIIIRADGSEDTNKLIQEAADDEVPIPVITILEDNPNSKRLSFVTANDYRLGELYGERVVKLIGKQDQTVEKASDRAVRIAVMTGQKEEESTPNLLYSGIRDYVTKKVPGEEIVWSTSASGSGGEFESEETIRDILLGEEERPDMIVCLNAADTISACQCVIDYNLVGKVSIIGYYTSSEILDGIQKGIIDSTIVIETEEIGRAGIDGLNDYFQKGYVSEYLQVDSRLITQENIDDYAGQEDE